MFRPGARKDGGWGTAWLLAVADGLILAVTEGARPQKKKIQSQGIWAEAGP